MNKTNKSILDKINESREYRAILLTPDAESDSYKVSGYATTFDEPYLLWEDGEVRVFEIVDPHAFDACDMRDVIFQYDHVGRVYARTSNGTLTLATDNHGLRMNADLGGTEIGRCLYGEIKGGYTNKMSFGFIVKVDKIDTEERDGKTIYTRRILSVSKLYDVSAVSIPANDGTEISARSALNGEIQRLEAERLQKAERTAAIERLATRVNEILGKDKK